MKNSTLKILLILITGLLALNKANAQTYVSGGIYSNTTWTTAGSPYIITGNIVVFSGVTLTIQSGAVVKFDNHTNIDVRGVLNAIGTVTDSIIFTSNDPSPYAGIYSGISGGAFFKYCRFSYADTGIAYLGVNTISHCLFNSDFVGVLWGNNTFDTCIFAYDSAGIWCSGSGDNIIGCEFLNNSSGINGDGGMFGTIMQSTFIKNNTAVTGIVGGNIINSIIDSNRDYGLTGLVHITSCTLKYNGLAMAGDQSTIMYNTISNNAVGIYSIYSTIESNNISDNGIGIETYNDKISCNTICNNSQYNIKSEWSGNELADNNFWCLTDSAAIQATIYDAYQNINDGFIFFTPFDTVSCPLASSIDELTVKPNKIILYPNPNNGSFSISISNLEQGNNTIEIYNMLGEMVYKSAIIQNTSQVLLNNSSSGIYLYHIFSENGNLTGSGKFVTEY